MHILKQVQLLVLLIFHDLGIHIVREVSSPFHERAFSGRDTLQADFSVDGGGAVSWLSSHYFVSYSEVALTEFSHSDLLDCIVSELHAHNATHLSFFS